MDLEQFTAKERKLIARIEKLEAELSTDPRGWGFFHAGDEALALIKDLPGVQFLDLFEACDPALGCGEREEPGYHSRPLPDASRAAI
jgi:hypothetical protein